MVDVLVRRQLENNLAQKHFVFQLLHSHGVRAIEIYNHLLFISKHKGEGKKIGGKYGLAYSVIHI